MNREKTMISKSWIAGVVIADIAIFFPVLRVINSKIIPPGHQIPVWPGVAALTAADLVLAVAWRIYRRSRRPRRSRRAY
jgi:protein-S-isoprenylcysteine O-methyltransferase Ste14